MCALLSGLYIGGDREGGEACVCVGGVGGGGAADLAKEGKKCVFKDTFSFFVGPPLSSNIQS